MFIVHGLIKFKKELKAKNLNNCYIFFGHDEGLIKSSIEEIKKYALTSYEDLNFTEFDGRKIENIEDIINACETLPFFSDYRIVLIYRAWFLNDNEDGKKKLVDSLLKYIPNISHQTILVIYTVFTSKRDKPGNKIKKFDKICEVIEAEYDGREKKAFIQDFISSYLKERERDVNKVELEMLFEMYKNSDTMFIKNELDKLSNFAKEKLITRQHIKEICIGTDDDDIFDLVDSISNKKLNLALDIMNSLIYRGEKSEGIIYFIERQLRLLLLIKFGIEDNKTLEYISKSLKLNIYVCKNMMTQSVKFTKSQLKDGLKLCLELERKLKTESLDKQAELELLIIKLMSV